MFDRLPHLRLPPETKHEPEAINRFELARAFAPNAVKIVADNASEYLQRKYPLAADGAQRYMTPEDWPAFNCPYRRAWIEYRVARTDDVEHFCGAIVSRADVKDDDNETTAKALIDYLRPELDARGVRFVIHMNIFQSVGDYFLPTGELAHYVGEHGQHIETYNTTPWAKTGNHEDDARLNLLVGQRGMPIVFAMAFMACKNVERVGVNPTQEQRRQHQRRYGRQLDRYHVLNIDARTRAEAARINGTPENSGQMPHHIVAGHYSRYGFDGRGRLFGKHTGQFWIPEHERGNAGNGIVRKDYRIGHTPDEEAA
jgi:hypothetical protein